MVMPTVSILIPVYNREHLIGASLEAALGQTYQDLEVVVVDNASTDGTWQVCERYARQDSRIRLFRNPQNLGPVSNWARTFEEARGQYGKILFSDDLIRPEYLETTLPLLADATVGFAFSAAEVGADPSGETRCRYFWRLQDGKVRSEVFRHELVFGSHLPESPSLALFRLSDLRRNLRLEIRSPTPTGAQQYGAGPDLLLYLHTARTYEHVAYVNRPLVFLREHPGAFSTILSFRDKFCYYTQARIAFLEECEDQFTLTRYLALAWITAWKREGRPCRFIDFTRRFLDHDVSFSLRALTGGLTQFAALKLKSTAIKYWYRYRFGFTT